MQQCRRKCNHHGAEEKKYKNGKRKTKPTLVNPLINFVNGTNLQPPKLSTFTYHSAEVKVVDFNCNCNVVVSFSSGKVHGRLK